jgi:hypothetical protein
MVLQKSESQRDLHHVPTPEMCAQIDHSPRTGVGPDIQLLGSFGVREIVSRTPKGYWRVSVTWVVLCALVVVSVAVAARV